MTDYIIVQEKIPTIIFDAITTPRTSDAFMFPPKEKTIEAYITGSGDVSAAIAVYGCNTKRNQYGTLLASINLTGTDSDAAGAVLPLNWGYIYVTLVSISGTNAAITFTLAI
jgi:hypothetical protein